jgi:hypothetical protein
MDKKRKPEPDDKEQSSRFVETAHALEVDESGKDFARAFRKIVPKAVSRKKKARNK